jgi:hypothetical protein
MVSVSFWHATGTVCSPPGLASPSVHKYKAQHDYKNDAEHKHQAANAEAMTRLRDQRDTGHRNTVPRECYAQRGCTVSRYVLNTRRSTHWSPYRLGPWPMRSARLHGPPRPGDGEWMDLHYLNPTAALVSALPGPSLSRRPRRRRALTRGAGSSPRWCREDPAACRVGGEGLKQRGDSPYARGHGGGAPAWTVLLGAGRPRARRRRPGRWCCCGSLRAAATGNSSGHADAAALAAREAPSESVRPQRRASGVRCPALLASCPVVLACPAMRFRKCMQLCDYSYRREAGGAPKVRP